MRKIVFATKNEGKLNEVKRVFAGAPFTVVSAAAVGFVDDIEENGATLRENAEKKAQVVMSATGLGTFADDTGFFIDALHGAPGVKARRWAGGDQSDEHCLAFALKQLVDVPSEKRTAHFESVFVYVEPKTSPVSFAGKITGHLLHEPRGIMEPGLPYGAIFVPDGFTTTFAELTTEEKNKISHRGSAALQLRKYLERNDTK